MKTLYLCGGINGLSDADCTDWREAAKKELEGYYTFLDPMRRDYRGRELEPGIAEEIVEYDLEDLERADISLVNAVRPSWGTAMEVHHMASILNKPNVVVCPGKPSPWLKVFSYIIVPSFEEAFEVLRSIKQ